MAINTTPTIQLTAGGPPVQINVECHQGPNGSIVDTTSTLRVQPSQAPTIATIAVHPTDPRAVVVTPGGTAGPLALFVNEDPPADRNLQVNVEVVQPPSVREIVFLGSGPVV
jgi:hypothetical protein